MLNKRFSALSPYVLQMFYLNSTLNFGIPLVLVFQLEVYYKVDRLLTGLTTQQKGTAARWYSNKTSQCMFYLSTIEQLDQLEVCLLYSIPILVVFQNLR